MDKKRLIRQWIGFFIIFAGFIVLVWPFMTGYVVEKKQTEVIEKLGISINENAENRDDTENVSGSSTGIEENTENKLNIDRYKDFYEACQLYNKEIIENNQEKLVSLEATERFDVNPMDYGYEEEAFGSIWIPRLDVTLPLYLGASRENMAKGGTVFGQTSVPISKEESANSSIAGHRGFRGAPFWRDIQLVQIGDPIYVATPWEKLTYRVIELRIVTPEDNSWCQIREGENLITLMTCHPYTQHYQRYVVFAELTDEVWPSYEEAKGEAESTFDESPRIVNDVTSGKVEITKVEAEKVNPDGSEYGAVWSNIVILTEDKIKIFVAVLGIFEIIVFIWLATKTRKYKLADKEEKEEENS